ncbi:HrpE/YscL family type III secretion apparatus protein [Noviherbaspirillum pedocola]|uniref:Type 3 secretion system stator protein n=1 Tax=Noviherbaspirillum pedocola TaxID=2801341 RepID=A0A934SPN5_9BURK|nr:HrpE/YscL family type III secretion apparatus protein [Noviherbaspirillum pedocola]MBK4733237.1 HrpE/YscL family type III secretion apparatus protein [Noviherbaspirillum pedocola]
MAFLFRSIQDSPLPEIRDKIIKAEDFWAYRHASEILEESLCKQEDLIREGEAAYVRARERGYEAGLEAARAEQSREMMTSIHQKVAYLNSVERQLSGIVMSAICRIINDFSDKDKVLAVVRLAVAEVRNQKQILLKVNPEVVSQLQDELIRIQELYPMVAHIEVVPQGDLATDSCIVETEIGVVQASITSQLRALHQSLTSIFGRIGSGDEGKEDTELV